MSLVRARARTSGRALGGHGRGAFALGDTVQLTPVDQLALQVNRFGLDAPPAYQFHTNVFAIGNPLDLSLAATAMLIYQRRAMDSYAQFQDAASSKLIANANAGMADPIGWVTSNLADVTGVVKGYGDSVGLPAAAGSGIVGTLTGGGPLGIPVWGWLAGGAAALWAVLRRKR